jgi:Mlc titration factor MtfA (ptsG expression regulator)
MRHPFFYKKLDFQSISLLEENFIFYKNLSSRQKKLFNHRVFVFITYYHFVGKEGLILESKMKVLIAGTAIMLTFGFDSYLYNLFETILVYPNDFFSYTSQRQHKGETNPAMKVIVFSWEDFKEGLIIKDDNFHLGLHEFAHALHFSFIKETTHESDFFIDNFEAILEYVKTPSVRDSLLVSNYLREYAFENKYELFAVMVEHFYESPIEFREKHPILFKMMGHLLQINSIID